MCENFNDNLINLNKIRSKLGLKKLRHGGTINTLIIMILKIS